MDTPHVRTPDLMCDECTSLVENAVARVPGVVGVTATLSLSDNTTSVLFDKGCTDRNAVIGAIRRAGFEAEFEGVN